MTGYADYADFNKVVENYFGRSSKNLRSWRMNPNALLVLTRLAERALVKIEAVFEL
jgi:hypothetical protein